MTTEKRFYRLYSVTRQYGGPEEGGWYFDAFHARGDVYEARKMPKDIEKGLVEIDASHPLKLPQQADNRPDYWDGNSPMMPWDDEAPTPRMYAWLVEFGSRTPVYDPDGPDLNERMIGYDLTTSQRVCWALSEDDLHEDLASGYDPETDECPKLICLLPDEIALATKVHKRLLAIAKDLRHFALYEAQAGEVVELGHTEADIDAVIAEAEGK